LKISYVYEKQQHHVYQIIGYCVICHAFWYFPYMFIWGS